ncbi:hypothetical protein [uncultured Flavobacterium sp.]|jgi:hypothetical protein|uniref:hypothetical protein n=1 Tax=uncultured Flavobacterium sp. TaxID=165435 RepID=UPI00121D037D|nr:hypothetical protein [uncultured Flavobacterium sp.]THD32872.1 MAG: hypothetical protein DI588_06515 [Flavobacterium johnsoniae]
MKYQFKKEITNPPRNSSARPLVEFGVKVFDKNIEALEQIEWHGWTPSEVQMIIDKSKALRGNQVYNYQVSGSDLSIHIYPEEVYFFDWRTEREEEDFKWSFNEFIDFMEQFKKFIKENS